MLRSAFPVFGGLVLVVLLLIIGWAVAGMSGPESLLAEAERASATGRFPEAIRMLDLAERHLGSHGDPALVERLLRLRSHCNEAAGSGARALADLDRLLASHAPGDRELQLRRGRLLIEDLRADEALRLLLPFATEHGDDGAVLELAGEALQRTYQEQARRLVAALGTRLSGTAHAEAVEALLQHLYLPASDPRSSQGYQRFQTILAEHRMVDVVTSAFANAIEEVRIGIQQARRLFLRALQAPGQPPQSGGAWRGLAFALEQARRDDELVALSETFLRRFDRPRAEGGPPIPSWLCCEVAGQVARAHLRHLRHDAILELAERFLPAGRWAERLHARGLTPELRHLLAARARALHARGQSSELLQLATDSQAITVEGKVDLRPELHLIFGLLYDLNGNWDEVENHFRVVADDLADRGDGGELFREACLRRLRAAKAAGMEPARIAAVFAQWSRLRPASPEPHLWYATWQLELQDGAAAFAAATRAFDMSVQDEAALRTMAAAANLKFKDTNRDAAALLANCLALGQRVPQDLPEPALLLPLAALALEQGQAEIALHCARRASDLWPWARVPRRLWAQAALARNDPADAIRALEALRAHHRDDRAALALLRIARRAAGLAEVDLLHEVATVPAALPLPLTLTDRLAAEFGPGPAVPLDPELARFLLERALQREDLAQVESLLSSTQAALAASGPGQLAAARAQLRLGHTDAARNQLVAMFPAARSTDRRLAAEVGAELLLLDARAAPDEVLMATASALQALFGDDAQVLRRLADGLERLGRPQLAYPLLAPLLTDPAHAAQRRGADFAQAARLAHAAGQSALAEEHWTAALAFPDAQVASTPLALLLLTQRRLAEARDVFGVREPRDVTSAALLLRFGQQEPARAYVRAQVARAPMSVPLRCLEGLLEDGRTSPRQIADLVRDEREAVLDVLTYAGSDGFAKAAFAAAERIRKHFPNPIARWLWAHVQGQAGALQLAIDELSAICLEHPTFTPAYDELVRLLQRHGDAALDPRISAQLQRTLATMQPLATSQLLAVAGRDLATFLAGQGTHSELAFELMAQLWIQYPAETRAGLREVLALLHQGRPRQALDLMDALERAWPADQRRRFAQAYGQRTRELLPSLDEALRERVRRRADALLEQHGPLAALVLLRLALDPPLPVGRQDAEAIAQRERQRSLLAQALLAAAPSGTGTAPGKTPIDAEPQELAELVARLAELEAPGNVLEHVARLLRADPSLLPVWGQRALLLAELGQREQALATLRWLARDVQDLPSLLLVARLAAEGGRPAEDEETLLLRLLPGEHPPAESGYVLGLLAFRAGRYERAEMLLRDAVAHRQGLHLWYRALANLALPGEEAAMRAHDLLTRFATDYPDNSLSESAGHLAAQLAPAIAEARSTK
jgi:hypothetical protein